MIMSTIKSYDDALDFYPPEAPRLSLARFGNGARLYWRGLCEGLAAAGTYKELMRRGVPHDKAVRQVFDEHFGA
jgi:hypothetical protein